MKKICCSLWLTCGRLYAQCIYLPSFMRIQQFDNVMMFVNDGLIPSRKEYGHL